MRGFWLIAYMCLGGIVHIAATAASAQAQSAPTAQALAGQVSSPEEGAMEGVLVSARRDGATITVTVVTDAEVRNAFPPGLEAGRYALSIRAVGYRLEGPKTAEVPADAAVDLKLSRTKNVAAQLSSGEWLLSMPGADQQKAFLTQCVGCHTLQRVIMSTHDAEAFQQVFRRMAMYSPGSSPTHPQPLLPGPRGERPVVTGAAAVAAAEYLAGLNMSTAETLEFPLKTLPRPKGRATKVVITEYDLPRKEAMPHDVIVDGQGNAWYS